MRLSIPVLRAITSHGSGYGGVSLAMLGALTTSHSTALIQGLIPDARVAIATGLVLTAVGAAVAKVSKSEIIAPPGSAIDKAVPPASPSAVGLGYDPAPVADYLRNNTNTAPQPSAVEGVTLVGLQTNPAIQKTEADVQADLKAALEAIVVGVDNAFSGVIQNVPTLTADGVQSVEAVLEASTNPTVAGVIRTGIGLAQGGIAYGQSVIDAKTQAGLSYLKAKVESTLHHLGSVGSAPATAPATVPATDVPADHQANS